MNPDPAVKRETFVIHPNTTNEVEVDPTTLEDLPPHSSLSVHWTYGYPSPRWILETLSTAFRQGSAIASRPLNVLSLGTGGNAYEEINALLYLTKGQITNYLGVDNDAKKVHTDHKMLRGLPFAHSVCADVKQLDSIVSKTFDVAIIRNPELRGNYKENMYTWGIATQKLKSYLTEDSLLIVTVPSDFDQAPIKTILSGNKYQEIRMANNPSLGPLFGVDKNLGMKHHYDKYIVTAKR